MLGQTGQVDPDQMPQNAADQGLRCLPLIQY